MYKLVASRPQDLKDAEGLMVLHGPTMDLDRVRRLVSEFAAILDDNERPRNLERLIARTGIGR